MEYKLKIKGLLFFFFTINSLNVLGVPAQTQKKPSNSTPVKAVEKKNTKEVEEKNSVPVKSV